MKQPWIRHGVLLVGYVVLFALGRATRLTDDGLALWWPAAGVAMLWGLTSRSHRDLLGGLLLLGATSATGYLLTGMTGVQSVSFAVANAFLGLGAWGMAQALRRCSACEEPGRRLRAPADLAALLAVVLGGTLASLPPMLLGVAVSDMSFDVELLVGWITRQMVGGVTVFAVVLCVAEARRPGAGRSVATPLEMLALVLVSGLVVVEVFGPNQTLPLAFLVTALAVWSGARLAPLPATAHALVVGFAVGGMYFTGAGGPLQAVSNQFWAALVLQALACLTLVLALVLSLGAQEKAALLTSLRRTEERERSRADLLDTITASMASGLVVVDASRRIHVINDDARALLGLVGDTLPRESDLGLGTVDGSPVLPDDSPFDRALRGEHVEGFDVLHVHPVTGERRLLAIGSSTAPVTGTGPLAVLVVRDVTERYRRLRQVESFAGTVAHDLQNPLTAAMGWAELLGESIEVEDPAVRQRLEGSLGRVTGAVGRAQSLVGDLLDYSTASTATIRPEEVDVDAVVAAQVADITMRYPDRRVVVELEDLGVLFVDRALFSQLIANLVGNAVKYVAPGAVPTVKVAVERDARGARLRVTDNGTGIPDEHKLQVFEPFHRAHTTAPGTGLGLAICAHVAERHGGTLGVHDGPTGGSVFTLTLPSECLVDHDAEQHPARRRSALVSGMGELDLDADTLLSRALTKDKEIRSA